MTSVDPADALIPPLPPPRTPDAGALRRILFGCGGLMLAASGVAAWWSLRAMTELRDVSAQAVGHARPWLDSSAFVAADLGEPVSVEDPALGSPASFGTAGRVGVHFRVKGARESGEVVVWLQREGERWTVIGCDVIHADGRMRTHRE